MSNRLYYNFIINLSDRKNALKILSLILSKNSTVKRNHCKRKMLKKMKRKIEFASKFIQVSRRTCFFFVNPVKYVK